MRTEQKLRYFPLLYLFYQILIGLSAEMLFPAFYSLAEGLRADIDQMQGVVPAWLAGISLSQLFLGPLVGRFGKRAILFGGGLLFFLAAACALFLRSIEMLWIIRFVQGTCNGAFMVAGYAAIGSLYEPKKALSLLAAVTASAAATQMIGSFVGSHLLDLGGWRSLFTLLFALSLLLLLLLFLVTPQMKGDPTYPLAPRSIALSYRQLLANRPYFFRVVASALLYTGMILWSTSSPYFILGLLHLSPDTLGMIQIPIYGGFVVGSQLLHLLLRRWEVSSILRGALLLSLASALLMWLSLAFFPFHLLSLLLPMIFYEVGFGLAAAPFAQEVRLASPASEGSAMSLYFFTMMGIGVVGSLIMSLATESPLFFAAALAGVSLASHFFYGAAKNNS